MIREQSSRQTVFDFDLPFGGTLKSTNRWVKLAEAIPWDALGSVYHRSLHPTMGPPAIPSRIVIGAMIIKHMKKLSDEEVIEDIRENPYCQYFLGFNDFQYRTIFVPSLFVEIRKRLGLEQLQEINDLFLTRIEDEDRHDEPPSAPPLSSTKEDSTVQQPEEDNMRSGMLIIDASVAPGDIRYPTDVDLLNTAREKAEAIIDELWEPGKGRVKPRTYRRVAHKSYLSFTRQRKPRKNTIRKVIRQQLGYLNRDLKHIERMLDNHKGPFPLSAKYQRTLWIIKELYRQQKWMHENRRNKIEDRIVSISQPHIRPIVRGKSGKTTEFGAKISAVVIDGNLHLDNLSWDAYNESIDLKKAVEKYKERFGFYPEDVNADKIYWNSENRRYLKSKHIALYGGAPLGRPRVKNKLSSEEKREHREKSKRRNWIEAKFGEGKRRYGLGLVMAKTKQTSESWIAMVIFVINVARCWRDIFFPGLFCFIKGLIRQYKWSKENVCPVKAGYLHFTETNYAGW